MLGSGLGLMRAAKGGGRNPPPAVPATVARGLPTTLGELLAGRSQSHTQVWRDRLGASMGCGNGPGGQEKKKTRGVESPESFSGVGNGSTEVSPLPLLPAIGSGNRAHLQLQQTPAHSIPHKTLSQLFQGNSPLGGESRIKVSFPVPTAVEGGGWC